MDSPVQPDSNTFKSLAAEVRNLIGALPGLLTDRVRLFSLELKRAGQALGQMVALGLLAAIFVSTAWVALWAGFAQAMIALGLAWPWAAAIVVAINLAAAAWGARRITKLAPLLTLPATLRRLTEPARADLDVQAPAVPPSPPWAEPSHAATSSNGIARNAVSGKVSAAPVRPGVATSSGATESAPQASGLGSYWTVLKKAGAAWVDDKAQSMGAALAYYTVFSIAPLLLIAISVAGLAFGQDAARDAIVEQLQALMGQAGADAVQSMLQSTSKPSHGILGTVVGVVVLIIGATSVFAELQDDLNRIWEAPSKAKVAGWWAWLRTRILSMGLILAIGFLMLISLAASALFDAAGTWVGGLFGSEKLLAEGINFVISYVLTAFLLALIYRFMPDATIRWRDVWVGAFVTALLFVLGKFLIGLYIAKSALASGFGAAGSFAVLLAWVYYSAQIFLFGAEFTWAHANPRSARRSIQANERATPDRGSNPVSRHSAG